MSFVPLQCVIQRPLAQTAVKRAYVRPVAVTMSLETAPAHQAISEQTVVMVHMNNTFALCDCMSQIAVEPQTVLSWLERSAHLKLPRTLVEHATHHQLPIELMSGEMTHVLLFYPTPLLLLAVKCQFVQKTRKAMPHVLLRLSNPPLSLNVSDSRVMVCLTLHIIPPYQAPSGSPDPSEGRPLYIIILTSFLLMLIVALILVLTTILLCWKHSAVSSNVSRITTMD